MQQITFEGEDAEAFKKRAQQIKNTLAFFKTNYEPQIGKEITFIDNAVEEIVASYFNTIRKYVKSIINDKIEASKMCSGTELIIMKVKPIKLVDNNEELTAKLTTDLAMLTSFTLQYGMNKQSYETPDTINELDSEFDDFNRYWKNLMEDRKTWLETLFGLEKWTHLPVMANSFFWQSLFLNFRLAYKSVNKP